MKVTYQLKDVERIAKQLIENVKSKTLLFRGEMGVGKTTLISAIIKVLGSHDDVSSPTFSIVNEYQLNDKKIYHFDLYRINDLEEAYNFGIEDYLDSDNWIIIEWPEILEPLYSGTENIISIELLSENTRQLVAN
ncbi:tRNA (adenosine(37)-N6)-threonylcarbamoyltransferase complex ATPase subunit type 1 TsaE [Algibacter miyuki]|uniref:tRNA threonylcarbamoyladenosine biosynthesis protein TsaE n=1 Tax=Algibacter miyuki TaxID=1306933 RepID=A0ABV5GY92_9FLAO|nr:tRNA (adenosine(37)-N6)-threonylcarbamoyltransferase complex ATPase subunit type 1 TsaE [Algibacter miyuki]MDN3667176.1 tRNA (adenosine(37)-N6)-threonylcarbamoyltransferase complex ATPase subunit type 1 TsaE [Algibacter miyuki]